MSLKVSEYLLVGAVGCREGELTGSLIYGAEVIYVEINNVLTKHERLKAQA